MKKSKWRSRIFWAIATIITFWVILTLWAQTSGPNFIERLEIADGVPQALVVFDPDPIYNLDEQVCRAYLAYTAWPAFYLGRGGGMDHRFDSANHAFCSGARFCRWHTGGGRVPVPLLGI